MEAVRRRPSLLKAVAAATVVVALALGSYGCGADIPRGKVVFSTDLPKADSNCSPSDAVTSVTTGKTVYATYVFKAKPGDEVVSISVTKDGADFFPTQPLDVADTKGLDCFGDTTDLSTLSGWGAGVFHFSLTSNGAVVAEGDLTVK